ncbi:hypothetical protein LCGC14_0885710 [marine sediment metagenome]|uniref:Uncharacterized protein n=1 Tax=marine sediment metagenome TaxID=412755 RepID=A0A0F9P5N8_9ZZZZ
MTGISGDIIIDLERLIDMAEDFIKILEKDYGYDLEVSKDFIKKLKKRY